MKIVKYCLVLITMIIFGNTAFGAKSKTTESKPTKPYPTGCKQIGYEFSNGVLVLTPVHTNPDQSQVIYFMQNISTQEILMSDQRNDYSPYIMHNNNSIKADQWAVFAADKVTKFICSKNDKKLTVNSMLDCENTIKVCEYANVKFAPNNRGNYWATSNMSMKGAVREVIHQGILLKS